MPENKQKTILAIDDDITVLTTIRTILEDAYELSLAKTAEIAMTILNSVEIDLILLDMEMPGVSGLKFLGSLHKDPACAFIPVIIVSSHGTPEYIISAKKAGAKDFVVKPIIPKVLLEKIQGVLNSSPERTPRDMLIRTLSFLITACRQGKGARVDELVNEVEKIECNKSIGAALTDICVSVKRLDYALAIKKLEKLISLL